MAKPQGSRHNPAKEVFPIPVDALVSAFGIPKVSLAEGLWAHKNVMGRGESVMDEWIEGLILNLTGVVGTFEVGEVVTGSESKFDGEVTAINGDSLTIETFFQGWDTTTPDVITGGTSSATGNLATVTGASITYNANESTVSLNVTSTAGDRAIRQSARPIAYVSGKGQVFKGTGIFASGEISIVRRDSTGGSVKTKTYPQAEWNRDKFDGTNDKDGNPSEIDLDPTKRNIYWLDLEWLAAGKVRLGCDFDGKQLIAHQINHANTAIEYDDETSDNGNRPYMSTASLPVRYEIYNDGTNVWQWLGYGNAKDGIFFQIKTTNSDATTMKEFCHAVESDGGYILPGLEFSTCVLPTQSIDERTPILGIRLKDTFAGKDNRKIVRYLNAKYFAKTNDTFFELAHIHRPTDITGDWVDIETHGSGLQYSTNLTFTARGEHIIDSDDVSAAGGSKGASAGGSTSLSVNQHSFIARDINNTGGQFFVIYATPHTGTALVKANLTTIEFD
jgi:hypothetical protein